MKAKIVYIERKFWREGFLAFSLEKVFEQISRSLPTDRFFTEIVRVPYGNSLLDLIGNLLFFRKPKADIYHITGQIHYLALVFPKRSTVLTIHDAAFLRNTNGSQIKRYFTKKLFLDLPVNKLDYITTVSETTRNEIIAQTNCPPEKIRVIENPVQEHYLNGESKAFNKQHPTILQVGITENKNISNLIKAIKGIPCRLKIVGNLIDELRHDLETGDIDYQNVLGLDDQQMRDAYARADMLAFCSTYEGFGLPIIEAQAMQTPVITSDLSPMKEVSGGAAYLADPYDPASIRQGILKIINDDEFRESITKQGLENVKRFQPDVISKQYQDLYLEILEGK